MLKITKSTRGYAMVIIVLLFGIIAVSSVGYIYFSTIPTNENVISVEESNTPTPSDNLTQATSEPITSIAESSPIPTLTPSQPVSQKKMLKINSYGSVDLGGNFTATLKSASELNNYVTLEVMLKNGYSSLLGLNTIEFTLHDQKSITKPTRSVEIGLNSGESKTIFLVFKKLPNPPFLLNYDHPITHISKELGTISTE